MYLFLINAYCAGIMPAARKFRASPHVCQLLKPAHTDFVWKMQCKKAAMWKCAAHIMIVRCVFVLNLVVSVLCMYNNWALRSLEIIRQPKHKFSTRRHSGHSGTIIAGIADTPNRCRHPRHNNRH